MLDAQALLEGVWRRRPDRRFPVSRRQPRRLRVPRGSTEADLVGRSVLETMPNLGPSGLLARYAQLCE